MNGIKLEWTSQQALSLNAFITYVVIGKKFNGDHWDYSKTLKETEYITEFNYLKPWLPHEFQFLKLIYYYMCTCTESQNVRWTSLTSRCIVLHRGGHCMHLGLIQRWCCLRNHGNTIVWWIYGNLRRLSTFSYFTCFIYWKNILNNFEYSISVKSV